jgi:phosphoglycolate phosphatase
MLHIIWDFDGTLIDSQAEIIYTIELALQDAGFAISGAINPIRTGPPLDVMIRQAFPAHLLGEDKLAEIIACFRRRYDNSDFKMTVPYDGIESIVNDKHFIHHIITNKPYYVTKRILEKIGWVNQFTTIVSSEAKPDNVTIYKNSSKSKMELFADIILQHDNAKHLFVGIGDMKSDCIAARNNNIKSIGVLWGAGTREELSDCCDFLFDDAVQLHDFLCQIRQFIKEQ